MLIGHVPRYLAFDIGSCEPDFIEVTVERVNPDAPLQHRLLCRMNACWPEGFRPCSGEDYLPLVPLPAGRNLREASRIVRVRDAAVQHGYVDGPAGPQRALVLRPV
jgi:hypothetical protein